MRTSIQFLYDEAHKKLGTPLSRLTIQKKKLIESNKKGKTSFHDVHLL